MMTSACYEHAPRRDHRRVRTLVRRPRRRARRGRRRRGRCHRAARSRARGARNPLAWSLEAWGTLRDYARQLLVKLESPRFASRLERLPAAQATAALRAVQRIRAAADPRTQWALKLHGRRPARLEAAQEACAELRRAYFAALEAA